MDNIWIPINIVPEPIEFRLYYDDTGRVLHYTCEKLEGNFIVVDAITYAEARPDIRVIDGNVARTDRMTFISRLTPNTDGVKCAIDDVTIIVGEQEEGKYWDIKNYEFGNN